MNRMFQLTLALTVVLGLVATQVFARGGGGHGGGHHGGGHHAGHHSGHHAGHHDGHHGNHHHHTHYANHNRPFTHGWYGQHNGAWGGWGWGAGNAWAPAAFGTAAAWLGLSALEPVAGGYTPIDTTVYTADQGSPADDDVNQTADDDAQPEDIDVAKQAAELAKTGQTDPPKDTELLPLGVYSLAPQGQAEASAMLQLSVSKDGVLRGSYCDLLSNQAHPITGAVDKKTQRVAWTVSPNGKTLFETSLANLTQEKGPLSVHYEDGESRAWTVARYEGDEAESSASPEAPKANEASPG